MESYLIFLFAYLFLNKKADDSTYKITFLLIVYIISESLFFTGGILCNPFLLILGVVIVSTLVVVNKGWKSTTLMILILTPKILDLSLCINPSLNLHPEIIPIVMDSNYWMVSGVSLILLLKESSRLLFSVQPDPESIGYPLFILNAIFGVIIISSL